MDNSYQDVLVRNNVTVSGSGTQPIIFLHGLGADQQQWRLLAPNFEKDYKVVKLDLVGSGESDLSAYSHEHHGSLSGHAADLLNVMQALDLTNAVFVGHSVSAMIGVLAAVRAPRRFARLVLVAPSPRFLNDEGYVGGFGHADVRELLAAMEHNYVDWSNAMAPMMISPDERPEMVLELTNSFVRNNPAIARHFARVTFLSDSRAELPLLTTPALIMQCAHDVIAPLAVGTYLNEQIPDSQMVVIDTPGHCPHLTASEQMLRALDGFLHKAPATVRSAAVAA